MARRRMTFDEFLALLPKSGWRLRSDGAICRKSTGDGIEGMSTCPWVYVAELPGIEKDVSVWRGPRDKREPLFDAADNRPSHNPEIRARLLKACGLKEAK